MKNKIEDLRDHLFATLEDLRDRKNPMDLERAKVISEVAQTIVNSAKVENEFLRYAGGGEGSGFIPEMPRPPKPMQLVGESSNVQKIGSSKP